MADVGWLVFILVAMCACLVMAFLAWVDRAADRYAGGLDGDDDVE